MSQEHGSVGRDGKPSEIPRDGIFMMVRKTWATLNRQWKCGRAWVMLSLWPGWDLSGVIREAQSPAALLDLQNVPSLCINCWSGDWVPHLLYLGVIFSSSLRAESLPWSWGTTIFLYYSMAAAFWEVSGSSCLYPEWLILYHSCSHSFVFCVLLIPRPNSWYIKFLFPYLYNW